MPQTREGNAIKQTSLTSLEKEVIEGCLLGDGTLTLAGKNYRLRVEHSERHKDYVDWKFRILRRLYVREVQPVPSHASVRFGTVGHPEIALMRQLWYRTQKQVPDTLVMTPMKLAIWFMDDGTRHRDTVDFSVHSFSSKSLEILRCQMQSLGLFTTINSDAKGARLYLMKKSYLAFKELVNPYMAACMTYKLP